MAIASISNGMMSFGGNPVQHFGVLTITLLALNVIQANGLVAEACLYGGKLLGGSVWGAGQICYGISSVTAFLGQKAIEVSTNPNAATIVDSISRWGTFKQLTDKCFDVALLTNPQFAIPFRVAMTTGSLGLEYWGCSSSSDAYLKCADQQINVFKVCNDIQVTNANGIANAFAKCSEIKDEKGKDLCYSRVVDEFNENPTKEGAQPLNQCFASAPSCTAPWLERNIACAAFVGHGLVVFTRIAYDLAKDFVPAPLKTAAKVVDVATKVIL